MTAIGREKYMDDREVKIVRTVTEARAVTDLQAGRMHGVVVWCVVVWCVVDVALQTGLRASELAKFMVGDFDPKRLSLKVWRHKRRRPTQETIAISKELAQHVKDFIEWKELVGQGTGRNDPLFVGKRGPLTTRGVQQIWKSAIRQAHLPDELSIHCARHTMAVHLLKKSGNLRMVQKQLGHSNPSTTAYVRRRFVRGYAGRPERPLWEVIAPRSMLPDAAGSPRHQSPAMLTLGSSRIKSVLNLLSRSSDCSGPRGRLSQFLLC